MTSTKESSVVAEKEDEEGRDEVEEVDSMYSHHDLFSSDLRVPLPLVLVLRFVRSLGFDRRLLLLLHLELPVVRDRR